MALTAKEMFKELGFEQVKNNEKGILYQGITKKDDIYNEDRYFDFMHDTKSYAKWFKTEFDSKATMQRISFKYHKALTQQLKELGWL